VGFSYSYYARLSSATFHQHVHAISATLWYILVIVQPYLITRKKNYNKHRSLGAMSLIVAGMVAGSAFAIIPKNIDNVSTLDPKGFFNPTAAYFFALIDFVLVCMFVISVVYSIRAIKKRDLTGHVQWLVASVFAVLSPGLGRMLGIVAIMINKGNMEGITFMSLAIPTLITMVVLIVFYYFKYGSFKHPSFILLILCHIPFLFAGWLGDNEMLRQVLGAIFK
jgi:hypothetical protein